MSDNVKPWPKATGRPQPAPRHIVRPCDYGLVCAVRDLETQVGTIEAYNRLVDAANTLRSRIDRGEIKAQNPIFAASITG